MTSASPQEETSLKRQVAQQAFEQFVRRFGDAHKHLAYYAALPLLLTPELVNFLRTQFLFGQVPWIAEADLLLSDLCTLLRYELYVMDPAVRAYLLQEMKQELGDKSIQAAARLLVDYVKHLAKTNPYLGDKELKVQQWAAMVYLDEHRTQAEEEIATALQALVNRGKNGQAELAQLQRLIEEFRPQLSQYNSLIEFAKLLGIWLKGQIPRIPPQSYAVHGVELRLPTRTPPKLKTILLVEDESEVIEDIRKVLSSQYGIAVRGTDRVNEVIKLAESSEIDLILINRLLPKSVYQGRRVNGFEIVKLLKSNPNISSSLPIVGFSLDIDVANEFDDVAHEFLESGADGFYSKQELLSSGNYQEFVEYLQEIFGRNDFDYYLACGTSESSSITPQSGILLIGGAEAGTSGEDAATRWFLSRAKHGKYLVLRVGGVGRQADWLCDNYDSLISSAAELAINSREAANNPDVVQYIRDADALYICGGDANAYQDTWKGTYVEDAINYLINEKRVPVAATSAGMAILGEYYYAPRRDGVLSSEILENPFHHNTQTIHRSDFIDIPILKNTITDTHLDRLARPQHPETRYGRLFGFLARMVDEKGLPAYGIGLEEGAFVAIDKEGIATAFGNGEGRGADAYFLQAQEMPERIERGEPLIWDRNGKAVKVYRIRGTAEGSGSFDLNNWEIADGGSWEYWYTTDGEPGFTGPKSRVSVTRRNRSDSESRSDEVELRSEKGVDYTKLRDLLAAQKWKEADEETARVMCQAASRQEEGWLRIEDIDNFPCEDLRTINQLWLHYSKGHFGFSVQKEIYQSLELLKSEERLRHLGEQVGWRRGGGRSWNTDDEGWWWYSKLTFSLKAPRGHLPYPRYAAGAWDWDWEQVGPGDMKRVKRVGSRFKRVGRPRWEVSSLAQRLVTCKI